MFRALQRGDYLNLWDGSDGFHLHEATSQRYVQVSMGCAFVCNQKIQAVCEPLVPNGNQEASVRLTHLAIDLFANIR